MFGNLSKSIQAIAEFSVPKERIEVLKPLVDYIQNKVDSNDEIRLNFICTHNSRRSHLSQIWAQTMAFYFSINKVFCYSGGTQTTAIFPKILETLVNHGFQIQKLSEAKNPVYSVKFDKNQHPIICFSKTFDDLFNPDSQFAAIMTCTSADDGCPFIVGADQRLPIRFEDPKSFDGTNQMNEKYVESSIQIASEMYYVFSQIVKKSC
jgi:arsenate reductase